MADFELKLNDREILEELQSAFRETAQQIGEGFREEVPVESGRLRDSQGVEISEFEVTYSWEEEYADEVHNGAFYEDGSRRSPEPWTEKALQKRNVERDFLANYRRVSS